ncbi:Hypothetical protein, putative, partial [Bodo saltans]
MTLQYMRTPTRDTPTKLSGRYAANHNPPDKSQQPTRKHASNSSKNTAKHNSATQSASPTSDSTKSSHHTTLLLSKKAKDELCLALRKMGNNKSPGPGQIPNELLKLTELNEFILSLLNDCFAAGNVPTEFTTTKLAMIPKAGGNLSTPAGWRYIALMATLAKLFDRVLLNRLSPIITGHLRNEQNGFLPHRSTMQHAAALATIIEDHRTRKDQPLYVIYIDFSNAFPSITRQAIRAALERFQVPQCLTNAVLAVYHNHKAFVQTSEGNTDFFYPSAGVLQGDTLAPFLFVVVLDLVLHKAIDKHVFISPAYAGVRDLDFADDIALIANNQTDAQAMVDRIHKYALRVGLAINAKKTMFQYIGSDPNPTISCGGVPLVFFFFF